MPHLTGAWHDLICAIVEVIPKPDTENSWPLSRVVAKLTRAVLSHLNESACVSSGGRL